MKQRAIQILLLSCFALFLYGLLNLAHNDSMTYDPSIKDSSSDALMHPLKDLSKIQNNTFISGKTFFHGTRDDRRDPSERGIGPDYNALTCASCHTNNGRGDPVKDESTVVMLYNTKTKDHSDPKYKSQLYDKSIDGKPQSILERTQDKTSIIQLNQGPLDNNTYKLIRISTPVAGMGLFEAIPDSFFLQNADPSDKDNDGISGRISYDDKGSINRFGWNSSRSSVKEQTLHASYKDIGLTNSLFNTPGENPELNIETEKNLIFYARSLAPASRRQLNKSSRSGQQLFNSIGCTSCHTQRIDLNQSDIVTKKRTVIYPFSDFLLHNMGSRLSDPINTQYRDADEFRTAPLWGLGLSKTINGSINLMHDGRAHSIDEAIDLHEGEGLNSRNNYRSLTNSQKRDVIAYLNTL